MFDRLGYIKLPFLTPDEVEHFKSYYQSQYRQDAINEPGAYNDTYAEFSIIHSKEAFRRKTFQLITETFLPKLEKVLVDMKPLIANFILKEPGGRGAVPVHQNWSVVDESKFLSVSVWVPLVNAEKENGTLQFVDGSHKMFRGIRGSWGSHNFHDAEDIMFDEYLTTVPTGAGEAIILDDSILHYSQPNETDQQRLSLQLILIPKEAQAYYYYKKDNEETDVVERLAVDHRYFFEFSNWVGKQKNCRFEGYHEHRTPQYDAETFVKAYHDGLKLHPVTQRNQREPMFNDNQKQADFERDGFITLPLLQQDEIEELQQLFDETRPEEIQGIYSNVHGNTEENNRIIDQRITEIFERRLEGMFKDSYIAGSTFLVKGTGENSASTLHQDWNNVDETRFDSLSIWCPLVDVDEQNGCLQVLPGSHRMFNTIRSITIPSVYLDFDEDIAPYLRSVPVKAGTAVIYAHNLFHGSKPNYTDQVRVSVVTGVLPKKAQHLHYYKDKTRNDHTVEAFKIDRDFFFSGLLDLYDGRRPDQLEKAGEVKYDCSLLSKEAIFRRLNNDY